MNMSKLLLNRNKAKQFNRENEDKKILIDVFRGRVRFEGFGVFSCARLIVSDGIAQLHEVTVEEMNPLIALGIVDQI